MTEPVFSLVGTAIRSNIYTDFYNSFSKTNIPFEVVFAGNAKPIETMPNNFKYIYTEVKPSQCIEISARHAVGKYIILSPDDVTVSSGFLDRAYNYVYRDPDAYFYSFRYGVKQGVFDPLYFDKKIPMSPIVGISGIYDRKMWSELGGVDNRFLFTFVDIDMQLRFREAGRSLFIMSDCILEEKRSKSTGHTEGLASGLTDITGKPDRHTINTLWVKESRAPGWEKLPKTRNSGRYIVSKTRLHPVIPFVDDDILLRSQGTIHKKWK